MSPSFLHVYDCLRKKGPAQVTSSKGTGYSVDAAITQKGEREGEKVIIARPRNGQVRIHEDCWGDDITCQRTRAGGIYNGTYSIWDWYNENCDGDGQV